MKENRDKIETRQRRGLYFALAVCLVAIAVAAVSAYSSIMGYITEKNQTESTAEYQIVNRDDPETVVNTEPQPKDEAITSSEESAIEEDIAEEETPAEETVQEEISYTEEEPEVVETENNETYSPSETLRMPVSSNNIVGQFSDGVPVFCSALKDYRAHNGIDVSANVSEAVFAAGNGVVLRTYNDLLYGNVVEVEHGEYIFKYCGLGDTFLVNEGDTIFKNVAIGSVYSVPMESDIESHIHIEVTKDGAYVNPLDVITE